MKFKKSKSSSQGALYRLLIVYQHVISLQNIVDILIVKQILLMSQRKCMESRVENMCTDISVSCDKVFHSPNTRARDLL